jgi:hypothetical protein
MMTTGSNNGNTLNITKDNVMGVIGRIYHVDGLDAVGAEGSLTFAPDYR